MESQFEIIHSEKWDTLIILDACRYDCLKELLPETKPCRSEGWNTITWLKNTWIGYYDLTYISATPFVNRIGYQGFNATNHFSEIIEVWLDFWDDELGTVHPKDVYRVAKNVKGRKIIHFLQPHPPFILRKEKTGSLNLNRKEILFKKVMGAKSYTYNLPPEKVKEYYMENLKLVLEYALKLVDGYTIITSDHGEDFKVGHSIPLPELKIVPIISKKPKEKPAIARSQ